MTPLDYLKKIEKIFLDSKYRGTFEQRWQAITNLFNQVNKALPEKLFKEDLTIDTCLDQYSDLIAKLRKLPVSTNLFDRDINQTLIEFYKAKLYNRPIESNIDKQINDFKKLNFQEFYHKSLIVLLNQIQNDDMLKDTINNLSNFLKETSNEYNISNRDIFEILTKLQNETVLTDRIFNSLKAKIKSTLPKLVDKKNITKKSHINRNIEQIVNLTKISESKRSLNNLKNEIAKLANMANDLKGKDLNNM